MALLDPSEDRADWDRAWRAMPHRRLAAPPRVDFGRMFGGHFGGLISTTLALDPLEYGEKVWRESEICPVCGATTADQDRLPASLHPVFASGFRCGLGVWVHRSCFEGCPEAGEPAPIPW